MKAQQLSLFDNSNSKALQAGGIVAAIKAAMAGAAKQSAFSREQVVDRMNDIAVTAGMRMTKGRSRTISLDTLEKWLSTEEREHVPSLIALHIFCLALNDTAPFHTWLATFGCDVMTPEDRRLRDYGRACIEDKARAKRKRKLEEKLLEGLR